MLGANGLNTFKWSVKRLKIPAVFPKYRKRKEPVVLLGLETNRDTIDDKKNNEYRLHDT